MPDLTSISETLSLPAPDPDNFLFLDTGDMLLMEAGLVMSVSYITVSSTHSSPAMCAVLRKEVSRSRTSCLLELGGMAQGVI